MDFQHARINTAGAYICIDGCYLFAIGIRPHNGHIPVVRIGGHREGEETGWQCAVREVYEETGLHVEPCDPGITYLANGDHLEAALQEIQWDRSMPGKCDPCLVVEYHREGESLLSLMYLVETEKVPTPSSEVKGLVLLTEQEIHQLCREQLTLKQFIDQGGKAILQADFDRRLLLEPFAQLRLLSRILKAQEKLRL